MSVGRTGRRPLGRPAEGSEGEQAAALAEQSEGVFRDVSELLPAFGRLGVEGD